MWSSIKKKEILPFVTTRVNVGGHYTKWNKPDTGTQILYGITYMAVAGGWKNGEMEVKWHIFSVIRWIGPENLRYGLVTEVNNRVLHTWNLLTVNLKHSHHAHTKEPTVWGDGCVHDLPFGHHFTMYMCLKSSHCTPAIYTIMFVNDLPIKLG